MAVIVHEWPTADETLRIGLVHRGLASQLESLHAHAISVLLDAAHRAERMDWSPLVITCIYRTIAEDRAIGGSGIHSTVPHRAIDIRTRDVPSRVVSDLDLYLDSRWEYDPMRPKLTVSYSAQHGTGPHMHIQVCDRTRRRPT